MVNTARLQLIGGQFSCTPHLPVTLSLCQEQMDAHILCIYSPLTDVSPNTWAWTYREMEAAAENTLLIANSSSIKWILKALLFRKERTHNHLQRLSFTKCSHSVLTKLFFLFVSRHRNLTGLHPELCRPWRIIRFGKISALQKTAATVSADLLPSNYWKFDITGDLLDWSFNTQGIYMTSLQNENECLLIEFIFTFAW